MKIHVEMSFGPKWGLKFFWFHLGLTRVAGDKEIRNIRFPGIFSTRQDLNPTFEYLGIATKKNNWRRIDDDDDDLVANARKRQHSDYKQ